MTDRSEENIEDSNASELALESNRESMNAAQEQKKEQEDDPEEDWNLEDLDELEEDDQMTITSNDLYHWNKMFLKEILEKCNRSYLAELEDPERKEREKKMKEGRLLIKDANDDDDKKNKKKKSEESSSTSRKGKGKEKMYEYEQKFDAMKLISDITMGFCDYIDHIHEMATERVKEDELKWDAHLETGTQVIEKLTETIQQLDGEIEGMKKRKDLKEKYVKILKMLSKLKEINARLDSSPEIGIVSERNCTELELELCEDELKRCKSELREFMWDVDVARLKQLRHEIYI